MLQRNLLPYDILVDFLRNRKFQFIGTFFITFSFKSDDFLFTLIWLYSIYSTFCQFDLICLMLYCYWYWRTSITSPLRFNKTDWLWNGFDPNNRIRSIWIKYIINGLQWKSDSRNSIFYQRDCAHGHREIILMELTLGSIEKSL